MKLCTWLFINMSYILAEIFIYPKLKSKIKNKYEYILVYSLYVIVISMFTYVINFYEHSCNLTYVDRKKIIWRIISVPIDLSITFSFLRALRNGGKRISFSSLLLISESFSAIYFYISKEQDYLAEGYFNSSILKISVIIIYKIIKFFILKRNQKSIDCVNENINIKN